LSSAIRPACRDNPEGSVAKVAKARGVRDRTLETFRDELQQTIAAVAPVPIIQGPEPLHVDDQERQRHRAGVVLRQQPSKPLTE